MVPNATRIGYLRSEPSGQWKQMQVSVIGACAGCSHPIQAAVLECDDIRGVLARQDFKRLEDERTSRLKLIRWK
jgi:hypothetical protein